MEVGVNTSRNILSNRVIGNDNGAARVVGFMGFRVEVESGSVGIGGKEKGDVLDEGSQCLKGVRRVCL